MTSAAPLIQSKWHSRQAAGDPRKAGFLIFTDKGSCGIMVGMNDARPSNPCRILVVTDQRNMRTVTRLLLHSAGYIVIEAASGEEALAMLTAHEVDLMLAELTMEPMDGRTLLQRALEQTPNLQVLIMAAFGSTASEVECMRLGAQDYLQRPFKEGDLLRRVESALEHGRLVSLSQRIVARC